MATDFNKPDVTDAYATLLPGLVTANKDLARMLEPTLTGTSTNIPTGAVRWNAATIRWERYNGTSWVTLPAAGDNIYAISISGNAATATSATTATRLAAGVAGAIPYQSAVGATAFTAAGTSGYILKSNGAGAPTWVAQSTLSVGFATTAGSCSGNAATATTAATCSGNAATATTAGSCSGNSATATLATKASTLSSGDGSTAMTFNWSGQPGQPTWLWGGSDSDGANMYVFNPSNFSVAYAASAGNGGVTSVNGQTGAVTVAAAPTTGQVLSATAGAAVGEVGTYALLYFLTANTPMVAGSTYSGSSLRAFGSYFSSSSANAAGYSVTGNGPTMAGTWRALGSVSYISGGNFAGSLFLRIA